MNQIERQVTNLVLSQRLNELGVKRESLFYWVFVTMPGDQGEWRCVYDWDPLFVREDKVSAFLVGELGEMLKKDANAIMFNDSLDEWGITVSAISIKEKTEADARAKMLIYLLEKEIINVCDL